MSFKRNWDEFCPREWDRWEQNGTTYVIQDLPPEDDEEALRILVKGMPANDALCKSCDVSNAPENLQALSDVWMAVLKYRASLACYAENDGHRRLVAINVCFPQHKDDTKIQFMAKKCKNVYDAISYVYNKAKPFEALGLDLVLNTIGMVVVEDYRGARLSSKMLAAREPLCRFLGIKGSTAIFTSLGTQATAAALGFQSILEISIKELADMELAIPKDDESPIKVMIKRYD